MFTEDDTRTVLKEEEVANPVENQKKGNTAAKVAAGVAGAAGVVLGAATLMGASSAEETVPEPTPEPTPAPAPEPKPEPTPEPTPAPEPEPEPTPEPEPAPGPGLEPEPENPFFEENNVEVSEITTKTDDEGSIHHVATGTVNGHQAVFVDDGHGNVIAGAVDMNDNNAIDEGETVNLETSGVTMGDMANHMAEDPMVQPISDDPNPQPVSQESTVRVVAVEEDVDLEGTVVNVAAVEVNNDRVILIDANQDGEVNLMASDDNNNGELEDDEIIDVTEDHIAMPTQADVVDNVVLASNDELPDYSNDADITSYEA